MKPVSLFAGFYFKRLQLKIQNSIYNLGTSALIHTMCDVLRAYMPLYVPLCT